MKPTIILIILFVSIVILNAYTINEGFQSITDIKKEEAGDDFYESGYIMGPDELGYEMKEKTDYTKAVNDFDVEYHDSPEKLAKENGISLDANITWVFDPIKQEKIAIKAPAVQPNPIYYELGSPGYEYGGATYVPNYNESVLLSSTNGYFTQTT